jgi:hypothetical protein
VAQRNSLRGARRIVSIVVGAIASLMHRGKPATLEHVTSGPDRLQPRRNWLRDSLISERMGRAKPTY